MANYLIIGASSGIGKKLAEQLCESGHQVYGTYNKNKLISNNSLIEYHYLNVLDESLNLDYLPDTINAVVYCPGTINLKPFSRIPPSEFLIDFNIQVIGAIKIIQAVLPKLKNAENSSILLFSTVAVQIGFPFHSQVSASKGAIEGLTKALAAELAPKIRVNCIAPSLTNTPLAASLINTDQKLEANKQHNPLKRIGTPNDIADMSAFLLSDKANWITGQIMHIDGGMSSLNT
ncbi:MAG: SDR family oxidoreductase [Bacteroidia bacterium]|nr:SDR family oxidoreductase [Bacteroidia bacterium]